MSRIEIKERAKEQLGRNIFGNAWMLALAALLIVGVATGVAGSVLPGIGAFIVTGPLAYAINLMFLKQARNGGQPMELTDLVKGFTDDFGQTFLLSLMQKIFVALWSLLFVIPGIVKTYSYSMAFYVKVDHPDYDWNACLKESMRLMKGHKMGLFIQDLSFIGWFIVGTFCLGIGTLWVAPYFSAARTQFYLSLTESQD